MRYDAILLDADDTLFDFHRCERNAIANVLGGIGVSDPGAVEAYSRINRACWLNFEKGLITQARLSVRRFEELLALYGRADLDPAEICARYEGALADQAILIHGALDVVRQIAAKRPIAIVTNGLARCQRGRMAISPLREHVSAVIISQELGYAKPDPRMIEAALAALGGIRADRALMVGDSLSSDMHCAMNAGVDGCWYNPNGQARPADMDIRYEIRGLDQLVAIALQ